MRPPAPASHLAPAARIALSSLLVLAACGKDPGPAAPADSAAPLGQDPTVPAEAGEARAGVVEAGEDGEQALFGGITAEGRPGDVKLYNSLIQVVIQAPGEGHGMIGTGGHLIDADLVRGPGEPGRDTVEDVFLGFGFSRVFDARELEILSDGSEGGAAVVEVRGTDVPWAFINGLFEYDEPVVPELSLDICTTYSLAPDSHVVEIRSELTNTSEETVSFTPQEGSILSAEDQRAWAEGRGFEGRDDGPIGLIASQGRRGEAAVSTWSAVDDIEVSLLAELTSGLGIFLADYPRAELAPGETLVLARSFAVTPDVGGAQALRWAEQGVDLGRLSGTVSDDAGPIAGARVHLVDAAGLPRSMALTDAEGRWAAEVPEGEWTAYAVAREDEEQVALPAEAGRTGPFAVAHANALQRALLAGEAEATPLAWAQGRQSLGALSLTAVAGEEVTGSFVLPEASGLRVQVLDDAGAPLPAVLDVRHAAGQPETGVPEALRDALGVPTGSRATWAWTHTGEAVLDLPPGTYTVTAGHSWRHEQAVETEVLVSSGRYTELSLTLEEVLPLDGWLSLDSHLHASPSMDGALPMEDRLVACAATGVALPVLTDHDAIVDYAPLASALGLDARMQTLSGFEVTTLRRGHFNLFPTQSAGPEVPNGGAEPWWIIPESTQELFERMQASAGEGALTQVNHPRTPGMFAFASYDPETGEPGKDELWSPDFELFELLNGGVDELEDLREDWFSFLSYGVPVVPMGSSDSHYRYIPCGLARTDVFLDTTDPAAVTAEQVREALLAGHVVVASGTTLRVRATGEGSEAALPGDTVVGEEISLHLEVGAPSWVAPGTLTITGNGELLHEQLLDAPDGASWLDDTVSLDLAEDTWLVVEVRGSGSQGDLWRGASPYAAANAIFVDVDGDGFTAPRSFGG